MSYILKIWEPPVGTQAPADLAAALEVVRRLQERRTGSSQRLRELVNILTARFPNVASPEAESMPESELAWSDGPLAADTGFPVLVLGLRTERLADVRPFVVAQATQLGLAVLDAQAGEAYFPGAVRLSATNRPVADTPEKNEGPPKGPEMGMAVFERLTPAFESHGFKPRKAGLSFKRKFEGGWQSVDVLVKDRWPTAAQFSLLSELRIDAVSELRARLVLPHLVGKEREALPTWILPQRNWLVGTEEFVDAKERDYRLTLRHQVEPVLRHVEAQVASSLLPVLDEARTVTGLDRLVNTDPLDASVFFQNYDSGDVNILVAYLAKNPRLPELCENLLGKITSRADREMARICAEYTRSHPLS